MQIVNARGHNNAGLFIDNCLEILATDDEVNFKLWKLMFACLSFDPNEEASMQTTHLTPLFKKNLKIYNINDANKYC